MPVRAPSVCGLCGKAHPSGVRCHRAVERDRERKARFDQKRPNARQRGYDAEWEREAKAFLAEAGNDLCARCGAPSAVVMHIQSIRKRPDLRMVRSNWRPGCHRCNAIEAAEERKNLITARDVKIVATGGKAAPFHTTSVSDQIMTHGQAQRGNRT